MKTRMKAAAVSAAALALLQWHPGAMADDGAAAREWRAYVEPLGAIGEAMVPKLSEPGDIRLRHELYRFLYSQIGLAYMNLLYQDPDRPEFVPYFNAVFNEAFPNPDDTYYLAPVSGDGIYRVKGFRGTVHMADFQIAGGDLIPNGHGVFGATFANHNMKTLSFRKDGAFEVILSRERPAGYQGDWWPLHPKATYLLLRQISYDWLRETDARISIERLDKPATRQRESAEALAAKMQRVPGWVENWTRFSMDWVARVRARGLTNQLQVMNYDADGGLSTQRYIEGDFDLAPDEALLVETELPKKCGYWNFQLTDEQWASVDWINRQSSINGFTARVDKDGKFRMLVSAADPGVPNWLDTGGLRRGLVYGRWTECSSHPTPKTTVIKVADARKHLPADTPVISAEARDAAIRERRMAVQLRRKW